jgi:hypothetical protein
MKASALELGRGVIAFGLGESPTPVRDGAPVLSLLILPDVLVPLQQDRTHSPFDLARIYVDAERPLEIG